MRRIVIAALAVAFITAVVSQASAHGPSQQRSRSRQSSRRSVGVFPFFRFQVEDNRSRRRHDDDFDDGFAAGVRAAQQRQFRQFQQFNDHCN